MRNEAPLAAVSVRTFIVENMLPVRHLPVAFSERTLQP